MSGEINPNNEPIARMLQDAFTFDGKFGSAEFSRFRAGFVSTVDECAKELGYENRDEMIQCLSTVRVDELMPQIECINSRLKVKAREQMARVVERHFFNGSKDQSVRSITQILLQKLRKGILDAENEASRLIAEILYGIVTLATLRI